MSAMSAVDANILVRFLIKDDPAQAARALRLFETEAIFVPLTVVLETFWVLRKRLRLPQGMILDRISAVARLPNVTVEDPVRLDAAVALTDQGLAFEDALHLASAGPDMRFATFDRQLIRRAGRAGIAKVFAP